MRRFGTLLIAAPCIVFVIAWGNLMSGLRLNSPVQVVGSVLVMVLVLWGTAAFIKKQIRHSQPGR